MENQSPTNTSPIRFTQVKRVNNNGEVTSFYNDCKNRLCNITQWNYMSLFNFAYKISTHDHNGVAVEKALEAGDFLRLAAYGGANKPIWFTVEEIQHSNEQDSSEEGISITLKQIENPGVNAELLEVGTLITRFELNLKRLINTISMDIKIANQNTIDQSKNFLNYCKWEVFAKQILLLL